MKDTARPGRCVKNWAGFTAGRQRKTDSFDRRRFIQSYLREAPIPFPCAAQRPLRGIALSVFFRKEDEI